MPKLVQELNNFNVGTITTPDARDIPEEAASYSLDLDSVVEDGLLRGVPTDAEFITRDSDDTVSLDAYVTSTVTRSTGVYDVFYYKNDGNKLKVIYDLEDSGADSTTHTAVCSTANTDATVTPTNPTGTAAINLGMGVSGAGIPSGAIVDSIASDGLSFELSANATATASNTLTFTKSEPNRAELATLVSSGDEVCMETNNREVHVGTGSAATDVPKWAGHIDYGQFGGSAPNFAVVEDAELSSLEGFPAFYKTVYKSISSTDYIYGISFQGSHIYRIKLSDGEVTKSSSVFDSLQGLCLDNDTDHLWVYDGGKGTEGTLYKVDISASATLNIVQTSPLESSLTNIIVDGSSNKGKLTDIINIGGTLFMSAWVKYATTKTDNSGSCKWLYKVAEPTTDGVISLTEVTPTWLSAAVASPTSDGGENEGEWTAGNGSDADPTLRFFKAPLFPITGSTAKVGCVVQETNSGTGASGRTVIGNNSTVSGGSTTAVYDVVKLNVSGNTYLANHPLNTFAVIADTSSVDATRFFQTNGFGICNFYITGDTGFNSSNVTSVINTGQRIYLAYYDSAGNTDVQPWNDIADASVNTGASKSGGYFETSNIVSAIDYGQTQHGALTYYSDDSTNTTIVNSNGLGGGRVDSSVYTHSSNAKGTSSVIARSGIDIAPSIEANSDGAFLTTKKYFYACTALYDGYQESPLTDSEQITPLDQGDMKVDISLRKLGTFSKRISHINLYRGESADVSAGKPDGFMRLVKSFALTTEWGTVADTLWEADSSNVYRQISYIDNKSLGASYEAINGISETIDQTIVNYSLSTQLNGHHVVAKCYHKDLPDAERYIFKSKPGKFDQFNWTTDFLRLPVIPTAMAGFQGRLYAWDASHMYRINLDGMYIEDTYDGIGCIGHQAYKVSEMGMCFADENNIYIHNGRQPVAISDAIKGGDAVPRPTNDAGSSVTSLDVSWAAKASSAGANKAAICIEFDSKRNSFLIFWSHASISDPSRAFCWAYNLPRKRWDLWRVTTSATDRYVRTTFKDSVGNIYYSDSNRCYKFHGGTSRKRWEYMTKLLSMGQHTQPKKFYGWELRYKRSTSSTASEKYPMVYWSIENGVVWTHGTHSGSFEESSTVQNSNTIYTHMQGKLRAANDGAIQAQEARDIKVFVKDNVVATEVDSLAVAFRPSRKAARSVTY